MVNFQIYNDIAKIEDEINKIKDKIIFINGKRLGDLLLILYNYENIDIENIKKEITAANIFDKIPSDLDNIIKTLYNKCKEKNDLLFKLYNIFATIYIENSIVYILMFY